MPLEWRRLRDHVLDTYGEPFSGDALVLAEDVAGDLSCMGVDGQRLTGKLLVFDHATCEFRPEWHSLAELLDDESDDTPSPPSW